MTGEQLYQMAKSSPAAQACIPLNFEACAPRIRYKTGWIAEFWYYFSNINDGSIFYPQYYLAIDVPSGAPVQMLRLHESNACMGPAPELITTSFYENQLRYLEKCANLMEKGMPTQSDLEELEREWHAVHPKCLADWLCECNYEPICSSASPTTENHKTPCNLTEYWRREMAIAIRAGDSSAAQKAKLEMEKAAKANTY